MDFKDALIKRSCKFTNTMYYIDSLTDSKKHCDGTFNFTMESVNHEIHIYSKKLLVPTMYIYLSDNVCAVDTNVVDLKNKLENLGIYLEWIENLYSYKDFLIIKNNNDVNYNGKKTELFSPFKNVQYISDYKEIIIKNKKVIIIKDNNKHFFDIPVESVEAGKLISDWESKYTRIISSKIKSLKDKAIVPITGGCDTRILTHFWRNFKDIVMVYNKPVKPHTDHQWDGIISKQILKKLNCLDRLTDNEKTFIDGNNLDIYVFNKTDAIKSNKIYNELNYLIKPIAFKPLKSKLLPFMDDCFYRINQDNTSNLLRTILLLLYSNDLLDIKIHSLSSCLPYMIQDLPVKQAEGIISGWLKAGLNF